MQIGDEERGAYTELCAGAICVYLSPTMADPDQTPAPFTYTPPPLDRTSAQLTIRALATGMTLGATLSICNVYLGLKIGWGTNMSVTGILLAFAFWYVISVVLGPMRGRFTLLENNINQSACSAAAAVSSAGLVAPIPAWTIMTGERLPWHLLAVWVFAVCLVGITVATGLRRQMIIVDKLPFPSGIACAKTLTEIYSHGREALQRVAMMLLAAVAAGGMKLLDITKVLTAWPLPFTIRGADAKSLSFEVEPSFLMVGVGGLIGFRAGASMLLGAILGWLLLAPIALERNWAELTARERFTALPEGVTLPADGRLQFRAGLQRLDYRGIMTAAERDRLLNLSDDAAWTAAISRLALASDRDGAMAGSTWSTVVRQPAAAPPAEVLPDVTPVVPADLAAIVRADEDALVVIGALTEEQSTTLVGANRWLAGDNEALDAAASRISTASKIRSTAPNFSDLLNWMIWPGVTLMVVSSLVSFSFSWRSMLRAFRGSASGGLGEATDEGDLPRRWFIGGCAVALVAAVTCQTLIFGISWWAATLAVLLSFVLAVVASRVSGETNITPIGPMGKVTQLIFGVLSPNSAVANLMTANVTGGASSQCADLMHDFKCGHMLGASPRKQFVAQVGGALAGAMAGSLFYMILIPDPARQLLTEEWAAPAVAAWKAVAEVFLVGLDGLPKHAPVAMLIAAIVGIALPILEQVLPRRMKQYLPSASSLGLAFVINAKFAMALFAGATIAWFLAKFIPSWTGRFLVTICAGIVVGDSLVGAGDAVFKVIEGLF